MFAFDTVNPYVWKGATEYLAKTRADFVAIQECRVTKLEAPSKEQEARNVGWRTAISPCTVTGLGGKSAGVSISSRNHIGMKNSLDPSLWPSELVDRFTLKHVGAVFKGGVNLGSCYLISCSAGVSDPKKLDILQWMACVLSLIRGPWAIGGLELCS